MRIVKVRSMDPLYVIDGQGDLWKKHPDGNFTLYDLEDDEYDSSQVSLHNQTIATIRKRYDGILRFVFLAEASYIEKIYSDVILRQRMEKRNGYGL